MRGAQIYKSPHSVNPQATPAPSKTAEADHASTPAASAASLLIRDQSIVFAEPFTCALGTDGIAVVRVCAVVAMVSSAKITDVHLASGNKVAAAMTFIAHIE